MSKNPNTCGESVEISGAVVCGLCCAPCPVLYKGKKCELDKFKESVDEATAILNGMLAAAKGE